MTAIPRPKRQATPRPGSAKELKRFAQLQAQLGAQYRRIFPDPSARRTVLIVPSLTLDHEVMAKVSGYTHYEERMLCLLLLLRFPHTQVIYVTSQPIAPAIIDYYLQLLPGVPRAHALRRLSLLSCHDGTPRPLTEKILERPRLLERIRQTIPDPQSAHMTCFNVSALERRLAVRLGIPIYGCDPELLPVGSKSGSREIFLEAGLDVPDGFEHLRNAGDVAEALAALKARNAGLRRAVVKLNEGFSGEGNAVFDFAGAPAAAGLAKWIRARLPDLAFAARDMTWWDFSAKIGEMGAVAEIFLDGRAKRSPSAQYRITPLGQIEVISTHDQVIGGASHQLFLGCRFPAARAYRLEVQARGMAAAKVLQRHGVLGRFGVDFISLREGSRWRHYAVEINLRKGGTTHPFLMLQFLTDGNYDPATGLYRTPAGKSCYYFASDNVESPRYRGLLPEDLIDIAVENGLHFNGASQEGVVFHLIGALSEFGKLGVLCVCGTRNGADRLFDETVAVLDRAGN